MAAAASHHLGFLLGTVTTTEAKNRETPAIKQGWVTVSKLG